MLTITSLGWAPIQIPETWTQTHGITNTHGNPLRLERETLSQDQDGNETRVYLFRNEIWYGNVGEKGQGKKRNSNTMWISRQMYIRVNNRMWRMWRIVNHRVSAGLHPSNVRRIKTGG